MDNRDLMIENAIEFVKKCFKNDATGHDWWHIYRVWKVSLKLAKEEKADLFVVQLAALLHDLDDYKLIPSDEPKETNQALKWLTDQGIDEPTKLHICQIIHDLSFKGAGVETPMHSIEGKVVQDADRLDAIGALGIARAFAYGGSKNRSMYDPEIQPGYHLSFEAYKNNQGTTVNHFYEKLFLLKDRMNTQTAITIAEKRHEIMQNFIASFKQEWEGED